MSRTIEISGEEKLMIATGLLLYREYKSDGRFDVDVILPTIKLVEKLGLKDIYEKLQVAMPRMKVAER